MILDNENKKLKVHEWIASYTEQGKLDIVTGYFTIGALAWLSKTVNDKISDFRLVLGDIVNFDSIDQQPGNDTFGFDDLSLERYRLDLLEEFNKDKAKYMRMPKGVYTGFKADTSVCAENGLIA